MRDTLAWALFIIGAVCIVASIARLQADGLTVLGAFFWILWFWFIGVFTRAFWCER